ncbi:MAG: hypothetical protein C4K47_01975 [Candidatus Thorarchaeota archaeon]|nr:MAG: hypothetical protein C4K47_01975 [Candidatus Thorarchaeota archaeon]
MSEDLRETALKVYAAIFERRDSVEVEGATYLIEKTSKSKLRSVEIEGLTFIEQNPNKESRWAQLAKEGHQIMWVMRGRQYIARVMDGKFLDLGRT